VAGLEDKESGPLREEYIYQRRISSARMVNLFSTGAKKKKEVTVDDSQATRPQGNTPAVPAVRKGVSSGKQVTPKEMDELPQLRDYPAAKSWSSSQICTLTNVLRQVETLIFWST
tara:strand:- start:2606 stop:2950 length:345 start_codon:yes stop_codon:yes gene_type:complete